MDNRSNILECAMTLFAARGYDAVGIQEIVDAAGVTKPTLYHYFSSKRGLLDALLERDCTCLLEELRSAALYQGNLTLTLQKIVLSLFAFSRAHPTFYRMQLAMYFAPPDSEPNQAVVRFSVEQHRLLEALFQQSVKEHGNMRGRQREYAATFAGMINTYIGFFLNGYVELSDKLAYQAVHQFMHGILS